MEVVLIVISILLISGGIVFSILPPLPGPLLTYGALISAQYVSPDTYFSTTSFIIWGIIGMFILILDYVLPAAAARRFGGTKAGMIGGMVGTIAGVILPIPFGIIVGPLLGAVIGDLYGGNRIRSAFKSGLGSFLGFVTAMSLKLLYAVIIGGVIVWKIGSLMLSSLMGVF